MNKANLNIRKVNRTLRIENKTGLYLACTDGHLTQFFAAVLPDELARINQIVQDYEWLIENIIEE